MLCETVAFRVTGLLCLSICSYSSSVPISLSPLWTLMAWTVPPLSINIWMESVSSYSPRGLLVVCVMCLNISGF